MPGIEVLLLLLLISSIPAVITFLWFRMSRYPFTFLRFMFSLLAGAASFFPALFLQSLLSGKSVLPVTGKWGLFGEIFIRIALTEEFSRLIMLFVLFLIFRRFGSGGSGETAPAEGNLGPAGPVCGVGDAGPVPVNTPASAGASASVGAAGLVAGFGFAILESAVFGASNPGILLPRMFTAALLHGACGARVGFALAMFPKTPVQAVFRFLTAVVIHGVYDFMLETPGRLALVAAVLIAVSALASSVLAIRNNMKLLQN
jgi:RsiW-degrading membrane proteinase PrsW (M82 family)